MFFRNTRVIRCVASFLLVESLSQVLWPLASMALTAGPTAPEASSFEPVDTTDMVNLNSGDFTYNLPLLEVPGPEGGFPVSLSYHAGLQPDVDASWVGLGWTLNPGAINRNVNTYADDHDGAYQTVRDYWEGGTQTSVSVGVNVGVNGTPASVSFGLSFAQDTYKGFGIGAYAGLGLVIPNSPLQAGVDVSISPYGDASVGGNVGLGMGTEQVGLSLGVGASTNFSSISTSANASISSGGSSVLQSSISSQSTSPSLSIGGGSVGISNAKAGNIQTFSTYDGIAVPVYPGVMVTLGYSQTRYWSDEISNSTTYGSLYFPKNYQFTSSNYAPFAAYSRPTIEVDATLDGKSYDTYRMRETTSTDFDEDINTAKHLGGSFADYDNYYVMAQGLSGTIRPYASQTGLYSSNIKNADDEYVTTDYPRSFTNKSMHFRFDNDFSNRSQQTSSFLLNSPSSSDYGFDANPIRGEGSSNFGYNATTDELAGSKHIEYFTNQEIISGTAAQRGFVNTEAPGFTRPNDKQIGGFKITNASGVTYHYALPAYSRNEHVYSENTQSPGNSVAWNKLDKPKAYAYTWYLTAMTGADFVNRGGTNLDSDDWGYWVSFDYGLLTKEFNWRNPFQGWHIDLDNHFRQYSTGTKDIYYLNDIRTRTHTALFVKEGRIDAKSNIVDVEPTNNLSTLWKTRGFGSFGYAFQEGYSYMSYNNGYVVMPPKCAILYPKSQLRLKSVLLFRNNDIPSLNSIIGTGQKYNISEINHTINQSVQGTYFPTATSIGRAQETSSLLDDGDLPSLGDRYMDKTIRSIVFNYDYSICPNTPNSFDASTALNALAPFPVPSLVVTTTQYQSLSYLTYESRSAALPINPQGKSTLTSIEFYGVGGTGILPPMRFEYDLRPEEQKRGYVSYNTATSNNVTTVTVSPEQGSAAFAVGDILKITSYSIYLVLTAETGNGTFTARFLGSHPFNGGTLAVVTTKNPPYVADAKDKWGFFKSDFDTDLAGTSGSTVVRNTTDVSSKSLDCWNLRRISSSLGSVISVNYEPDSYVKSVYKNPTFLGEFHGGHRVRISDGTANIPFLYKLSARGVQVNDILHMKGVWGHFTYDYNNSTSTGGITMHEGNYFERDVRVTSITPMGSGETIGIQEIQTPYIMACTTGAPGSFCGDYTEIISAYLTKDEPPVTLGGGIRVASIAVSSNGSATETLYSYNNQGVTSGVTSYEPDPISSLDKQFFDQHYNDAPAAFTTYRNKYYESVAKLNALARNLPAPGVMYEYATTQERITRAGVPVTKPGATTYQFAVFRANMLDVNRFSLPDQARYPNQYPGYIRRAQVNLQDFTSQIGTLKRITRYTDASRRVKLSETVNRYLHDNLGGTTQDLVNQYGPLTDGFNKQGVIQEAFGDCRQVKMGDLPYYDVVTVMSQRNTYPTIQTGTTQTNFITNTTTSTQTLAFDFLSGAPTQTLAVDGHGNRWLTETTPAYRSYPAMGSKVAAASNRNMLTQTSATTTYKVNASNTKQAVLSADITTWSNQLGVFGATAGMPEARGSQPDIWRPWQSYNWLPTTTTADGLTPIASFGSVASYPNIWRKTSEVTGYDVYSNPIEAKDFNQNFAATKMGFNRSKVLITGAPASYIELAYSGAEEETTQPGNYFSGGVALTWDPSANTSQGTGDVSISTALAHTGSRSLKVGLNKHGFSYTMNTVYMDPGALNLTKAYRASVWTNDGTNGKLYYYVDNQLVSTVSGTVSKRTADGWYLLDLAIPPIGSGHSSLRVGCSNTGNSAGVYFDDFRVQPANAQASCYGYDQLTSQLSYVLDNNNMATTYDYYRDGRLKRVNRESMQYGLKKTVEYSSHAANALNSVSLNMRAAPNGSSGYICTVNVPTYAEPVQIEYNLGSAYVPLAATNGAPYTFTVPTPQWVRVRVRDSQGHSRELAKEAQ